MDEPQPTDNSGKIARIDVRGADTTLWATLRPKLIRKISEVLDSTLDNERGTTVREEAKQFTSAMLEYARRRLQREGLENDKIEAEIAELYAKRASELAQAESLTAAAEAQRQQTALRELCTCLSLTKAMLVGDKSEEAVLFGLQIESFLETVKELNLIR